MSTKITVTVEEAIQVIQKANLIDNKAYEYEDLKNILKYHFPQINDNQVSGLITRLSRSDKAIFIVDKQSGSRNKYIYSLNKKYTNLKPKIDHNSFNTKQAEYGDIKFENHRKSYHKSNEDEKVDGDLKSAMVMAVPLLIISLIVTFFFGWVWGVILFFVGAMGILKIVLD
ncbi:hypothetical protein P4U07_17855 [Bacillus mycoides]|uniref:hypothetical protein n=1 Tax=Bacillus mycoides TaxID=1405 RepID=UPI002E22F960|nr:hypothetical protein [Bacillus mycoides]